MKELKSQVVTHKLIGKLCAELANAVYEQCATRGNNWYAMHPDRKEFVRTCAPTLREEARRTLATMLGDPKLPENQKEEIHDALMLDSMLPGPRGYEAPKPRLIH